MYKKIILLIITVVVLTHFTGCSGIGVDFKNLKREKVKFSTENNGKKVSFTIHIRGENIVSNEKGITIKNGISDFTIPFNKINSTLKRVDIAGEKLVNIVEIYGDKETDRTSIIFRITTGGTGGGKGKIGGSIIASYFLDRNILADSGNSLLKLPGKGKLASSGGKLIRTNHLISEDMKLAGAKSPTYTMLASVKETNSFFIGFVVFDPTNPESIGNAYFEFSSSESKEEWKIEKD